MVNISKQDNGDEKKISFDVSLSNVGCFESSKFLHVTFF